MIRIVCGLFLISVCIWAIILIEGNAHQRYLSTHKQWFARETLISRVLMRSGASTFPSKIIAGPFQSETECERWLSQNDVSTYQVRAECTR